MSIEQCSHELISILTLVIFYFILLILILQYSYIDTITWIPKKKLLHELQKFHIRVKR